MARVTVEDCIERIPNRFELVMTAGQRARQIAAGAPLTVDRDDDKNPVVALREIADETIDIKAIEESLVRGLQKRVDFDEPEEDDILELMESEQLVAGMDLQAAERARIASAEEAEDFADEDGDEADGAADADGADATADADAAADEGGEDGAPPDA